MILRLSFILKKHDVCFIQWPLYTQSKFFLCNILRWKHVEYDVIIHDLNSFEDQSVSIDSETDIKNKMLLSLNEEHFILFGYISNVFLLIKI